MSNLKFVGDKPCSRNAISKRYLVEDTSAGKRDLEELCRIELGIELDRRFTLANMYLQLKGALYGTPVPEEEPVEDIEETSNGIDEENEGESLTTVNSESVDQNDGQSVDPLLGVGSGDADHSVSDSADEGEGDQA